MPTAICDKMRNGHNEKAEILEVIGTVNNKTCVIVDDFTISGGTLIAVAQQLKQRGAKKIYAVVSHALLSAEGAEKLMESDIDTLITTDSIQNIHTLNCPKATVVSVAPLFADAVRRIFLNESVSELFEQAPTYVLEKTNTVL